MESFQENLHLNQANLGFQKNPKNNSFACDVCGKLLKNYRSLFTHKYTHTANLRDHDVVHSRKKDFACRYCGTFFGTKGICHAHEKHVCKMGPNAQTEPIQCHLCDKKYKRKEYLVRHMKKAHLVPPNVNNESTVHATTNTERPTDENKHMGAERELIETENKGGWPDPSSSETSSFDFLPPHPSPLQPSAPEHLNSTAGMKENTACLWPPRGIKEEPGTSTSRQLPAQQSLLSEYSDITSAPEESGENTACLWQPKEIKEEPGTSSAPELPVQQPPPSEYSDIWSHPTVRRLLAEVQKAKLKKNTAVEAMMTLQMENFVLKSDNQKLRCSLEIMSNHNTNLVAQLAEERNKNARLNYLPLGNVAPRWSMDMQAENNQRRAQKEVPIKTEN